MKKVYKNPLVEAIAIEAHTICDGSPVVTVNNDPLGGDIEAGAPARIGSLGPGY